jgi:hypothetical protein
MEQGEPKMKLYGYSSAEIAGPEPQPLILAEATIAASPEELRSIAAFLLSCATEMEESQFDHAHLSDRFPEFRDSPQLVVAALGQ